MSRYEILRAELIKLRLRQAFSLIIPTIVGCIMITYAFERGSIRNCVVAVVIILLPVFLHQLWRILSHTYRTWSDRSSQIDADINELRKIIARIFEKYRKRQKGEHFKKAYDLNGRDFREMEEALSVGMFRERREVFVTAFIRAGVTVRVTASIGSPFRCSAADNPYRWGEHIERLGCDEIRQYHNHPVYNGKTQPSQIDIKTSQSLKLILGSHGSMLHSFIICWNGIREWKIYEHDGTGKTWIHFEFDAAG